MMQETPVLQWEMHGRGTAVEFSAVRGTNGYGLYVKRDDALLVTHVAEDGAALLRKSSDLREQLQRLGFAAKPAADRASQLAGGPCWGPAAPLATSVLEALR